MPELWVLVLAGALSSAAPLVLAGLGEVVLERAGAGIQLGIEGAMLCGALAAVLGGAGLGPWVGLGLGILTGLAFGSLYAAGLAAGINTVLVGVALTLLGTGLSGYVSQVTNPPGHTNISSSTLPTISLPGLGPLFSSVGVGTYLAVALTVVTWWMLRGTRFGLRLRAVGDDPDVATTRGLSVRGYHTAAAVIAGAFAGLAGAIFALGSIGTFTPMMTGGRGYIALAIVIIARRTPFGVLAASLLFAVFETLALLAQTRALGLPVEAYYALPLLIAIVWLFVDGRRRARLAHHITTEDKETVS